MIATTVLVLLASLAALARQPLTFDQRVKAQESIERIYYNHRIWPKENATPKPPFEQIVPKILIMARVKDYLKKSAALEEFWQKPITGKQLQAEMDRMARMTKDPATLRELFAALNNDPYLIAECLARPVLADRLVRNWYANDERFHGRTKAKAAAALLLSGNGELSLCSAGRFEKMAYVLSEGDGNPVPRGEGGRTLQAEKMALGEIPLDSKRFEQKLRENPGEAAPAILRETPTCFILIRVAVKTKSRLEIETVSFPKRTLENWLGTIEPKEHAETGFSTDFDFALPALTATACSEGWNNGMLDNIPDPRYCHTAVWTGTEMIIWGGYGGSYTGGRYNPSTDTWTPTSTGANCPSGRANHTAIWTGTEMIVWGGVDSDYNYLNTGGRYNPSSDAWTPTSTDANNPSGRNLQTAIWTGAEMIVWGGATNGTYLNTGGRYNPSNDSWVQISNGPNCPSAREYHTAVWTGTEMIIWGGYGGGGVNTGAKYTPSTDSWTPTSTKAYCPSARSNHSAVWTGTEMIIWGGYYCDGNDYYYNNGGRYDPSSDTWTAMSTGNNCPPGRNLQTAVWTGAEMIVWGGDDGTGGVNTGGRYAPSNDTWALTSTGANSPSPRLNHTAVWTGTEMIIWGGQSIFGSPCFVNTGGRYSPSSDIWTPTSTGTGYPMGRSDHTAVWTGSEMIVWGGCYYGNYDGICHFFNTGGRYNPSTDSWTPTSTEGNCPSARCDHTAVWTGMEMIVWGGYYHDATIHYYNTGGGYDPSNDTWAPTYNGAGCPEGRGGHTSIWTGTKMIVWGGINFDGDWNDLNTGGQYNPSTGTWTPTSTEGDCPSGRSDHTAVWTGTAMIVWGGYISVSPYFTNTGASYSPANDSWTATPTGTNCPSARQDHTAVWTGSEMIIWGGYFHDSTWRYLNTGGRYNPSTDTWMPTTTGTNCPSGRCYHTAVWTGSEMIVWGGSDTNSYLNTGGRYDPSSDAWTPTSTGADCPLNRSRHTAIWTGTEMIIWAGIYCDVSEHYLCSGGRYVPPHILIAPTTLPNGMVGIPYSQMLTGNNGVSPYIFAVTSGDTPPGLALFSGGGLLGAPTAEGSYFFTATATDTNGCAGAREYSVTIAQAAPPGETAPGDTLSTAQTWSAKNLLQWPSNQQATGYNLYRGIQADLPKLLTNDVDSCVRYSGSSTSASVNDDPTWIVGRFYWYLVTGMNANGEGPAGNATGGPRTANSSGVCQ
jgi:hypothetical protein